MSPHRQGQVRDGRSMGLEEEGKQGPFSPFNYNKTRTLKGG